MLGTRAVPFRVALDARPSVGETSLALYAHDEMGAAPDDDPLVLERYAVYGQIAAGGMATVHVGRLRGPAGFARTVAIKRLHPHLATDPEVVTMFMDEARLAARVRHPNVVSTVDVVTAAGQLFVVMDYIQGETLARLWRAARARGEALAPEIVVSIMCGVLHGLHAAHEAKSDGGEPLNLVHRDVSPQNVMVGIDGIARVVDFGVAKALGRLQTTREGQIKGKLSYMAPEQLIGVPADRSMDIYAASIVLWECLTGARLFDGESDAVILAAAITANTEPPSKRRPELGDRFDAIVGKGLARDPRDRYKSAREMALDLEHCLPMASPRSVGEWVERLAHDELDVRARRIAAIEQGSTAAQAAERPERASPAVGTSRGRRYFWGVLGVTGIAAGVVGLLATRATRPAPDVPAPSASGAGEVMDVHATAPAPHASPAPSVASTGHVHEPPGGDVAVPPGGDVKATSEAKPAHARPAATAPSLSRKECDPPFTVDARGRKTYKRNCM